MANKPSFTSRSLDPGKGKILINNIGAITYTPTFTNIPALQVQTVNPAATNHLTVTSATMLANPHIIAAVSEPVKPMLRPPVVKPKQESATTPILINQHAETKPVLTILDPKVKFLNLHAIKLDTHLGKTSGSDRSGKSELGAAQ